ncbi:MAG: type II secretion system minor pseudopilin GspJ [Acidiferrobacter sp.]
MTKTRGFTLLEMLVAIAIFAIVGAIAYTGLDRAMAIRAQLKTVRTRWEARGLAQYRLADDLSQVRARPVRNGAGLLLPAFMVRKVGRAIRLSFTTGGPPPFGAAPRSNLRRVEYTIKHGNLVWRRWAVLDRAPGERRAQEVLIHGVRRFHVAMLTARGLYVRTWPTAGPPAAEPNVVKVVVELKNGRHLRWLFAVGR